MASIASLFHRYQIKDLQLHQKRRGLCRQHLLVDADGTEKCEAASARVQYRLESDFLVFCFCREKCTIALEAGLVILQAL
jgi:hypothetical protein